MRKTYAYNSIIIAFLLALVIYLSTESTVLTVVAFFAIAIGGFVLIKAIENALYKGVDKAVDAAADAIRKRKDENK
ncbi:MAG: hypothetical protein IJH80_02440 [Ruminococcus sp.]|nr:hypothetical protein [Ruminococcus sp.]